MIAIDCTQVPLEQRCGLTEPYGGGFKPMSFNRETILKMDLGGMVQREQRREVVKKQQEEQQIPAASAEAYRRGFASAFTEANRKIHLQRLAQAFWLTANRDPASA
jgi:hypothetical protein